MKTFIYPDGTKSATRPSDGQIFIVWDSQNQQPDSTWQWDDRKEQWFNISSGSPTPGNTKTFAIGPFAYDLESPVKPLPIVGSACECGSEKCGSNKHSNWCPKFTT